ncbi:hypothetical protein DFJ58DRAFT_775815 [Suillus subalutaceus]|uniref:uncharacterized protein n=1 Tax=Suillus subalutaceus TaxID=48586 RepID=UPI001B885DB8|nr:uncharacterized protein DFJ58DRAFT_775815 [Suillus subalutaceus]KAG1862572.1 hypothetical protein DFJ58DRAFT_775815 [Suillus subalutaceus]
MVFFLLLLSLPFYISSIVRPLLHCACKFYYFPCLLNLSSLLHPLASSETVLRPLAQSYIFLGFSRAFSYRLALSRIAINFTFSLTLL